MSEKIFSTTLESDIDFDSSKVFDVNNIHYQEMSHTLGAEGMAMLDDQLGRWHELNEGSLYSPLRESLASGDSELPKGTLMHGMKINRVNLQSIESISQLGIVSGELIGMPEELETHGYADFFRVPDDMTISEYMSYSSEMIREGKLKRPRSEKMLTTGLTFIVDPNAEGMETLTEHDGYSDSSMSEFVNPISNRSSEDTAAILGGVPRGAIAGLIISPSLLSDDSIMEGIRRYFPDMPFFDTDGNII
jgi:hypothetical protein